MHCIGNEHQCPDSMWLHAQGFLDVGAGLGFYTLAAAAAGRHVEAYVAGNHDLMFLEASIEYNGFSNRIALHKVSLSPASTELCSYAMVEKNQCKFCSFWVPKIAERHTLAEHKQSVCSWHMNVTFGCTEILVF